MIAALFAVCILASCIHAPAPHLPSTWIGTYTDLESITNRPAKARLQVIIASGVVMDNHTALRLVTPGQPVVFWDPGGGYGTAPGEDVRRKDLIVVNPPDLETYLPFRWENYDAAVEIFEWDLEPAYAYKLYQTLTQGTEKNHPAGRFTTRSMGLMCSIAVSDFLNRFAADIMDVPTTYFWPHKLARVLYSQSPDRVLVFRRRKQPMVYIQPPKMLDVTHSPTSVQQ
jgi:hypothetical protein